MTYARIGDCLVHVGAARPPTDDLLAKALTARPDFGVRTAAARALLSTSAPRALEVVVSALDGADWRGGPFSQFSVAALFRLAPKKALDRLQPFLTALRRSPATPSMPVRHAFELLTLGPALRSWLSRAQGSAPAAP